MWPLFDSPTRRHMWVEFVVGCRPCSERFPGSPSPQPKTNISKFQFDLDYCQALYHEPLAQSGDCASTPRVIDIKYITFILVKRSFTWLMISPACEQTLGGEEIVRSAQCAKNIQKFDVLIL